MKQHGQDAAIHAALRADAMLDKGDLDGYDVWKRIAKAVEELQGTGACLLFFAIVFVCCFSLFASAIFFASFFLTNAIGVFA